MNKEIETATANIFRAIGIEASAKTISDAVKNARKMLPPRLYRKSTKQTQIDEVSREAAEYAIFTYPVYPAFQKAFKDWQIKNWV